MVKISKSELPQGIIIKTEEDYRSEKILSILQQDFFDKCYICEEKAPTTINVEHFRSYKNYKHLKYDWENLFFACAHCNRIKGSYYDHIIDCTKDDPEKYIVMKFNSYPESYVEIIDRLNGKANGETRELLDKIYNGAGTSISECEARNLKKKVSRELKDFMECVENYNNETDAKLRAVYWRNIKEMLNRESNFAGFKRSVVLQSEELRQSFGELMK